MGDFDFEGPGRLGGLVKIYLQGQQEPLVIPGGGRDEYGVWFVTASFYKNNYVYIKKTWEDEDRELSLFSMPRHTLRYIDWGNLHE